MMSLEVTGSPVYLRRRYVMWDDQKRQRFNELREPGRYLNAAEKTEVAALVKELEDMEAAYLKPANERLRNERLAIEKRNARLAVVINKKKAFVERLNRLLTESEAERRAIDREFASVLADAPTAAEGD